jgi:tRNA(Ile)-lysidine synthase
MDSMILLHLLHRFSSASDLKLVVAHFNHQLRGRQSDSDERFVHRAATALDLKVVSGSGDVKAFQQKKKISLEMAARKMRHDFLARTARQWNITTIALGHHADDQVELFFLRLLRGSSGTGLAGMEWKTQSPSDPEVTLVRPLLGQTKSELESFAKREQIAFRKDATNDLVEILRNRIRHELVPLLLREYQPALLRIILRSMDVLGANADCVTQFSRHWLQKERRPHFDRLPLAVQRETLHLQLIRLQIESGFDLIERLRCSPEHGLSVNSNSVVFRDHAGRIHRKEIIPRDFNTNQTVLNLSETHGKTVFETMEITWRIGSTEGPYRGIPKRCPGCEHFDADKVGSVLILRHWQPGDRFRPIGLKGAVKLQDLFTNQKVPRARRHKIVVGTTAQNEVFWVEGLRISDSFKLDKGTLRSLKWKWRRRESSFGAAR